MRSPSIDFLSSFRRPNRPLSPSKLNPFSHSHRDRAESRAQSPVSPLSPVALSPSKSVHVRLQISAPNTTTLNLTAKHVPVPLTLTLPTPTASSHPNRAGIPPSPDPDYVLITPNPSTPTPGSADNVQGQYQQHHSSPSAGLSGGPPSPTLQGPHVLAYYDLPPPSPPPRGPLPDVPLDILGSMSPSWSMMDSSSSFPSPSPSRFPWSAPADTALQHRPLASPDCDWPHTAPTHTAIAAPSPAPAPVHARHPLSRELVHDVPTLAQPTPPQRGRTSPFPTAPVLRCEQTAPLVRQTSRVTQEAVSRALRQNNAPASASPYPAAHSQWPTRDQQQQLDARWVPRAVSAAAVDAQRRPVSADVGSGLGYGVGVDADGASDDERSFLVYNDEERPGDISDRSLSALGTRSGLQSRQSRPQT